MSVNFTFKKSLLSLMVAASIIGCTSPINKKDISKNFIERGPETSIKTNVNSEKINKISWKDVNEYDAFVRSVVNNNYISDVEGIYNFYNIKRDLPKYGFKAKKIPNTCFDCAGGVYKEKADSIYFYSSCSKELFDRYSKYIKTREEIIEELHHCIKHEAAHAFYCGLCKELKMNYSSIAEYENISMIDNIQQNLIEEGVAEYIAYKGELTNSAKILSDKNFKEMIEKENDYQIYELGFILVKPILDLNFHEGIIELIKNPLTKEDLKDLPGYRERIKNIKSYN